MSDIIVVWLLAATFVQGHQLCSKEFTDLCISYSGNVEKLPDLQLKSRYDLETKNDTQRLEWQLDPLSFQYKNRTYYADNFLGGRAALSVGKQVKGVYWNGSSLYIKGADKCLSIMQCDAGVHPYCTKSSQKAVLKYQVKKGSYMGFRPCQNGTLAQTFVLDPPCAPGCNETMKNLPYCVKECMSSVCHYNRTKCATKHPTRQTKSPTQAKTLKPTGVHRGDLTESPTFLPVTSQPTLSPTNNSNTTTLPSLQPTYQPTFEPTQQPTKSPILITLAPSNQPSLAPTHQPTSSPTLLLPTTKQPTSSSSPTKTPTSSSSSSKSELTENQKIGIGVGLSLAFLLICLLIVVYFYKKEQEKRKKKGFGGLPPIPPNQPLDTPNPPPPAPL